MYSLLFIKLITSKLNLKNNYTLVGITNRIHNSKIKSKAQIYNNKQIEEKY